ncbi:FAD-binding oxidoreductase [bacterium]|nr:FAD-binding oxidoreductase [bacterium]
MSLLAEQNIPTKADVIILGGGVLGISAAYHLSQRRKSVLLLERETLPGSHASGKNAGMFRKLYRNSTLTDWASRSQQTWPEIVRNQAFTETPSLVVGRNLPSHHPGMFEEQAVKLRKKSAVLEVPAVYTKDDGLIDPGTYLQALLSLLDKSLVTVATRTTVTGLNYSGKDLVVDTNRNTTCRAPVVINACGAWLNSPFRDNKQLLVQAEVFARHLFVVSGFPDQGLFFDPYGFYWDESLNWYLRRWEPKKRLISICDRLAANPDRFEPPTNINEELAFKLVQAIPEHCSDLVIERAWHCFRTYTDDQLPIWGQDPTTPGLFWLSAFGGFGMSTSFAASADLARLICGESVTVDPEFSVSRVRKKVH